ncbi:MAG: hypothetical protein HKN19_09720 [Halioglobus sp.]|nr:hypothetical protein [Halioglobus sp.]
MRRGRFCVSGCRLLIGLLAAGAVLPAIAGQDGSQLLFPAKTQIEATSPGVQVSPYGAAPLTSAALLGSGVGPLSIPGGVPLLQNPLYTNPAFSEDKVDESSPHPGLNQWNVGMPLVQQWGAAGSMTTLEFTPAISFFTEDENPFANDHLVREPLMRLGAHLSRDVIQGYLSLGLDVNYVHGGETQVQGVTHGARQSYRTVGVNASGQLTQQLGWSVEYSRAQSDEQGLDETDWYRLNLNYSF